MTKRGYDDPALVEDIRPWERLHEESNLDFGRFQTYRDLPLHDRTVVGAYRISDERPDVLKAPSWVYDTATKHKWKERAMAFDRYMDLVQFESDVNERHRARNQRKSILKTTLSRIEKAVAVIDFDSMSPGDAARIMDVTFRQSREEHEDPRTTKQTVTIVDGGRSQLAQLAEDSAEMTDAELVARYRNLTATEDQPALISSDKKGGE